MKVEIMSKGAWFWIIYVIVALFGGVICWRTPAARPWGWVLVCIFILVGLVGWAQFGPPMR